MHVKSSLGGPTANWTCWNTEHTHLSGWGQNSLQGYKAVPPKEGRTRVEALVERETEHTSYMEYILYRELMWTLCTPNAGGWGFGRTSAKQAKCTHTEPVKRPYVAPHKEHAGQVNPRKRNRRLSRLNPLVFFDEIVPP